MLPSKTRFQSVHGKTGPRETLRDAGNPAEIEPKVLLAILLRTGVPGCDVVELADRLIRAFGGSVSSLVDSDWRTIRVRINAYNESHPNASIRGLGEVKLLNLAAAFELARRAWSEKQRGTSRPKIRTDDSSKVAALFRAEIDTDEQEFFLVLPVDSELRPMCRPIRLLKGSSDHVLVHPREVFREAVRWSAYGIFVAHNHPGCDPSPSAEDLILTDWLIETSKTLGIPLLDHLILGICDSNGGKDYCSLRKVEPSRFPTK